MVRQEYLELLGNPNCETKDIISHQAVAVFIKEFLTQIKPNLSAQVESLKREQAGLPPVNAQEGDPYMEISPDLDAPGDLTTVN